MILTKPIASELGWTQGDDIVLEVVGDTLLVRSASAPASAVPASADVEAGLARLRGYLRPKDGEQLTEAQQRVLCLLRDAQKPMTRVEIQDATGLSISSVQQTLTASERRGLVRSNTAARNRAYWFHPFAFE